LISTADGSQIQILTNPVNLTVSQLNTQTLQALTSSAVKSVKWSYTSNYNATPVIATDSGMPFTIVCDGNAIGWYCPWNVGVGNYQVVVTAYDQTQGQGNVVGNTSLTIQVQ